MSVADIFVDARRGARSARWRQPPSPRRSPSATGVLALGGGAVLRAGDPRDGSRAQRVVWLRVTAADAATGSGMNRPGRCCSATCAATLAALLEQRDPVYEEVATDVVDTSGQAACAR